MLSRQERDRLEKLEGSVEELTQKITRAEARSEVYESQYAALLSTHTEALEVFKEVARQYTDGLSRARATIKDLEQANAQASMPLRQTPLHKTEEEEDLEFQLDHGVLSMSQYNEALRAAGLADD